MYNLTLQIRIKAKSAHNLFLAQRPKPDLNRTSGKAHSNGLIKLVQKLVKSIIGLVAKKISPKTTIKLLTI